MGNYTSQYESYYRNIRGKSQAKPQSSIDYLADYGSGRGRKSKKQGLSYGTLLIFQCIGSLILLLAFIAVKMMPMEGTKKAYEFGKEVLTVNQVDTEALQTFNLDGVYKLKEAAVDYVEELKSMVTGEETLKENIKNEYKVPCSVVASHLKDNTLVMETKEKAEVVASYDGKVKEAKTVDGKTYILIDHGNGVETYYGFLTDGQVKENDEVKKGTILGYAGNFLENNKSGIAFKLIYMGVEKNPLDYISM